VQRPLPLRGDALTLHSHMVTQLLRAVLGVAAVMPTRAFAQQPLEEFLAGARRANSDVQAAAATIEQQEGESLAALGRALPSLTARGIYTRNEFEVRLDPSSFLGSAVPPGGSAQSFIIQPLNQLDATVQFDAPIIDLAAWQRVTAQHAAERAARRRADATMTDVQMQVARNYYQLVGSRSLRQSAERTLEAALANLDLTRTRQAGGVATDLDVNRAQAEVERSRLSISDAELTTALAGRALQTLTGVVPTNAARSESDDLHAELPLPEWEQSLTEIPSVAVSAEQRRGSEATATAARFALLPSLSAGAQGRLTNATGFVGHQAIYVLTVALNWRLDVTSFGTMRSEDAAARLARVREGSARQVALDQIHESWSRISNGIAKSRAARAEALASTAAALRARERYREGAGTHFELVQAERDAYSAEVSRIQADADLSYARVALRLNSSRPLVKDPPVKETH
jgi:outer membrane protein TolC